MCRNSILHNDLDTVLSSGVIKMINICPQTKRVPAYTWWECKFVQPLWRTVWRFLKTLPYGSIIPLLGMYPEKTEALKKIHAPQCYSITIYNSQDVKASVHWQMNGCMCYTHIHNEILVIKKNEIMSFAAP